MRKVFCPECGKEAEPIREKDKFGDVSTRFKCVDCSLIIWPMEIGGDSDMINYTTLKS